MKQKLFLMAILCGTVLFFGNGCTRNSEPADVLLNRAADQAEAGNWAKAGALAEQVLKKEKNNVNALLLSAMAYSNLDSRKQALDAALRAAELAPQLFLAQYFKGYLLSRDGKYALALPALRKALDLRPNDLNTMYLLSKTAFAKKDYDAAAYYYKLLLQRSNRNPTIVTYALNGIGVCYAHKLPRNSVSFFRTALRSSPDDPTALLNLAVVYDLYLKKPDFAKTYYEAFIRTCADKTEYEPVCARVRLRLESMKER